MLWALPEYKLVIGETGIKPADALGPSFDVK